MDITLATELRCLNKSGLLCSRQLLTPNYLFVLNSKSNTTSYCIPYLSPVSGPLNQMLAFSRKAVPVFATLRSALVIPR